MWTQARLAIAVAIFVAWSAGLSYLVWQAALTTAAGRERDLMSKQLDQVLDEQAQDRKDRKKLQDTLDKLPRSQGKVRDAVRQAPSNCVLPPAVADSLREAIDQANAARALPAHP